MPIEIRLEQLNPRTGVVIACNAPDVFILHMNRAGFEQLPGPAWVLTEKDIPRLEGMRACWGEPNPFRALIPAIKNLGTVKIWLTPNEIPTAD